MKTLNEFYNKSCKPKCQSYTKITENITLIDNFFENFESAKNFFVSADKWECIAYQGYSKAGYESIFPNWVGKSLMEKYAVDNNIIDDLNSYNTSCIYLFEYESEPTWTVSSTYPHVDSVQFDNILQYICLINLNDIPVSTKFFAYKNQECCSSEMREEWEEYLKNTKKELIDYYDEAQITKNEFKTFLDNRQDLYVKLIKEIEYKPNQAIVYPANLFHSPNITQEFTEDNPRILLRILFDRKIIDSKKIIGVSYS